MSYNTSGKIPSKFVVRKLQNKGPSTHKMGYFNVRSGDKINDDFEKHNKSLTLITSSLCSLKAYTTPHPNNDEIILNNIPRKIRIIGAVENNECRSVYGSNYNIKILLSDEYVCLMSADVLADLCVNNLIDKNGEVNAQFVVVQGNGSTQLVRKDSGIYNACLEHMEELKKPTMKNLAFKYGKIYKKLSSDKYGVFLGYITTTAMSIKCDNKKVASGYWEIEDFSIKSRKVKMGSLWYEFGPWALQKENLSQIVTNQIKSGELYNFKCYLANSHKYSTDVGKTIELDSPKDVIYAIANKAYKECSKAHEDIILRLKNPNHRNTSVTGRFLNYDNSVRYYEIKDLYYYSPFVNLEIYGCSPKSNPIYKNIEEKILPIFKKGFNESNSRYCPH